MTALRILIGLYVVACLLALALIPASAAGWFGIERDPLSALFAMVLALPWSALLVALPAMSPWLSAAVLLAAMAVNVAIGVATLRRLQRRRAMRAG